MKFGLPLIGIELLNSISVSYTHLDVYKRQVPGSWPEYLTAIGTLGAVIISLFGESLKKWIRPSKVEIVDKSCLIQTGTGDLGVSRLRLRNTGSGVARNAVSYTHLDVYKRQAQLLILPKIFF